MPSWVSIVPERLKLWKLAIFNRWNDFKIELMVNGIKILKVLVKLENRWFSLNRLATTFYFWKNWGIFILFYFRLYWEKCVRVTQDGIIFLAGFRHPPGYQTQSSLWKYPGGLVEAAVATVLAIGKYTQSLYILKEWTVIASLLTRCYWGRL